MNHRPSPQHLLAPLALGLLAAPVLATGNPAPTTGTRGQAIEVPGLAAYSIQDLQVPPQRRGEPAVLAVDVDGSPYTFDLHPHSLRSESFRLIEVADGVQIERPAPPVSTYRGEVYGPDGELVSGARVLASEGDAGWSMALDLPGRSRIVVQPLAEMAPGSGAPGLHVVFDADDVVFDEAYTCGTDMAEVQFQPVGEDDDPPVAYAVTGNEIAEIAFDTDVEFYNQNGADVNNTLRDIERVMNIAEATYENEVNITYEITSIIVRSGALGSDPYSTTDPGGLLNQLANVWNSGFNSVRHDLVHLMTGKNLDSSVIGIAFLGVVCSSSSGYGLSQSRFTSNFNSRAGLTAHEIGHNWNASHCDGNGNCHIMCSGLGGCNGLGNPITFGGPSRNSISNFRNSRPCLTAEPSYLTVPFYEGWPLDMTVNSNKWVFNDNATTRDLASNEPTPDYSLLLNATGTNPGEQDDVRTHFIDTTGLSNLSVSFFTEHVGVEAGEDLVVEFRNQADRIWAELLRIPSDGVDQTNFEFHKVDFQDNMYHSRFRLRFRVETNEPNDHWFVDNVMVHDGPNLAQQPLVRGTVVQQDAYGVAPGDNVIYLLSLTGGNLLGSGVGPSFFGGALTLDILSPLINLGIVLGDANGVAHKPIFIPLAVSPSTQVWTQAVRLDPILANSTTTNVIAQTVQ